MGDLTKNLSRKEFACQCGCGFDTVDFVLINALQACCDHFSSMTEDRVVIVITSGVRCLRHNTEERELYKASGGKKGSNGALNSQHIYARAADFKLFLSRNDGSKTQISPEETAEFFEKKYPQMSIGIYKNRIHVDSRSGAPARWDER